MKRTPLTRRTPLAPGPGPARRTRRRSTATIDPEWAPARAVALDRDGNRCRRCGAPASQVHHRRLRGMGGSLRNPDRHRPDVLVSLCMACHEQVHAYPEVARELGYIVPRSQRTEYAPISTRTGWLILTAEGDVRRAVAA